MFSLHDHNCLETWLNRTFSLYQVEMDKNDNSYNSISSVSQYKFIILGQIQEQSLAMLVNPETIEAKNMMGKQAMDMFASSSF